ncbi:hypothetical protein GRS48_09730 [Halorubrum sp. JWXQ-INN 858]|uniref:tripartite tricarboxylate transporter TctB family protein n=1 Tax=Halorubrum sp. JWXQ-INN 858 TaxID=2690782 RepID=UPI00135948B3|nr:tripartite tricarboxylate transporter TctB family protein [Halorubrum sp. JWXQ-INN 858]MWV65096.1 hypothetical protein [Halorubrum sp. JWXQ-INN 858]
MEGKDRTEIALLFVFLAVATGFVVQTFGFRSSSAALFPRLTAAVVLVGGVLLLFESRLPEPVRRVVAEPVDLVDREEFGSVDDGDDPSQGSTGDGTGTDRGGDGTGTDRGGDGTGTDRGGDGTGTDRGGDGTATSRDAGSRFTPRQFLFAAVTGYAALAYVASILVATPLFVAAYGRWNGQRPAYVAVLALVGVGLCWLFIWLANAPLDRGLLFPRGIL